MPALLTRIEMAPNSASIRATMFETSLETETSALIARLRRPPPWISEHTFRASASRPTKFTATSAPASDNAAAMPAPIPRLAPVTNAIFPSSSLLIKT